MYYVERFTKYSDELEHAATPASVTLVSTAAKSIIQPTVCPSAVNSVPDPTTACYLPVASSWERDRMQYEDASYSGM